jgi:hypothetical protein
VRPGNEEQPRRVGGGHEIVGVNQHRGSPVMDI